MITALRQFLPQNMMRKTVIVTASIMLVQSSFAPLLSHVVLADPLLLDKPTLVAPETARWSKSTSVDFSWSPIEGATKYELRYGNNVTCAVDSEDHDPSHAGQFAGVAFSVDVTDAHHVLDGLADGQWCWQVRAVKSVLHAADIKSDWSEIRSIKTDTITPVVMLDMNSISPEFKGTADASDLTLVAVVDGTPHPEITITLASSPNTFGSYDWQFKVPGSMDSGSHVLHVKATDMAGNSAVTADKAFVVPELVVAEPDGVDPTITQTATLPLVAAGPLIFVAPTPAPIESSPVAEAHITPVQGESVPVQEVPEAVLASSLPPKLNGHIATQMPVQATGQGWALFGVTWYWWLLGGGAVALGWGVLARWRLASRLG